MLPLATGDVVRYQASVITPRVCVMKMGVTRMGAIINCLKALNDRVFYDKKY